MIYTPVAQLSMDNQVNIDTNITKHVDKRIDAPTVYIRNN